MERVQRLAPLGGWPGPAKTPIGLAVLMRGAMIFITAVQLCQQVGKRELYFVAQSLEPLPGAIFRRAEKL